MNIDDLTIREAKNLANMFGGGSRNPVGSELIGQKVIVRAYRAGVHYGTLADIDGENVKLTNARRLWFWQVYNKLGISLSDVAKHGISDQSKICAVVSTQIITDAGEIITTSDVAQGRIEGANVHSPKD